jgi:hypothetical protein
MNARVSTPMLFSMYQHGKPKLDELVTSRYGLDELNDAIADNGMAETSSVSSNRLGFGPDRASLVVWSRSRCTSRAAQYSTAIHGPNVS